MRYSNIVRQLKRLGFQTIRSLGCGSFGAVVLATTQQRDHVAIKVLKRISGEEKEREQEMQIAPLLTHAHLVKTLLSYHNSSLSFMVMEYVEGDNLQDHLSDKGAPGDAQMNRLFQQLTLGVKYLHEQVKLAHRDIKCENILLDQQCHLKLGDFGLCKKLDEAQDVERGFSGTNDYMAPEALKSLLHDLVKADVWSMGIVLYNMCSLACPARTSSKGVAVKDIIKLRGVQPGCKSLMRCLLRYNPGLRPNTTQILNHRWMK